MAGKKKVAAHSARISKTTVDDAEAGASRYILWDTDLKGFACIKAASEGENIW